jgi:hypothetical protein
MVFFIASHSIASDVLRKKVQQALANAKEISQEDIGLN